MPLLRKMTSQNSYADIEKVLGKPDRKSVISTDDHLSESADYLLTDKINIRVHLLNAKLTMIVALTPGLESQILFPR